MTTDDAVRRLLLARIDDTYWLATFMLRDPLAAEGAVQEAALLAWDRRRTLRDSQTADGWFTRTWSMSAATSSGERSPMESWPPGASRARLRVWHSTDGAAWTSNAAAPMRLGRDSDLAGYATGVLAMLQTSRYRIAFSSDGLTWQDSLWRVTPRPPRRARSRRS